MSKRTKQELMRDFDYDGEAKEVVKKCLNAFNAAEWTENYRGGPKHIQRLNYFADLVVSMLVFHINTKMSDVTKGGSDGEWSDESVEEEEYVPKEEEEEKEKLNEADIDKQIEESPKKLEELVNEDSSINVPDELVGEARRQYIKAEFKKRGIHVCV